MVTASECANCGATLPDDARFCPACGTGRNAAVELLGTSTGPRAGHANGIAGLPVQTVVGSTGPERPGLIAVAIGLGVVMVLGWALLGGRGTTSDQSTDPSTIPTTTTVVDPVRTSGVNTVPATTTPGVAIPSPVFDHETGVAAILGSGLVVDLDTGRQAKADFTGIPLMVVDDHLVTVVSSDTGIIQSYSLADLGAGPTRLGLVNIKLVSSVARSTTPGAVWILRFGTDNEWQLVDVASGELLRTVYASSRVTSSYGNFVVDDYGPEYASPPTGGVYVLGPDGYDRVFDGALVSVSGDFAIVEHCTDDLRCDWFRYRIRDWSTDGQPLETDPEGSVLLTGNGRLVIAFGAAGPALYDAVTRSPVDFIPSSQIWAGVYPSDDGRYLATLSSEGQVEISDLDTLITAKLGLVGAGVVLAPRSAVQTLMEPAPVAPDRNE
jgi:hypothetical protein